MKRALSSRREIDGKYQIVRLLGSGGMGQVYEADDRLLGRRVALKVLGDRAQDDEHARERLAREGRVAARVQHRHIVRIYEIGSDGETDYVAMELLEGEDLHARIAREGPLPVAFVQELALALANALIALHAAGVVHRDLKPKNLFLAREGDDCVLKVLDFGIAKNCGVHADETLTRTGQVFGTLNYMAPEQLRGAQHADERSDLWAVGAILYEALVGRPPFEADSGPELVLKIAGDGFAPIASVRSDVPESVLRVVARCLQRDPALRFPDAQALRAALRGEQEADCVEALRASAPYAVEVDSPLLCSAPTEEVVYPSPPVQSTAQAVHVRSLGRPVGWLRSAVLASACALSFLAWWHRASAPSAPSARPVSAPRAEAMVENNSLPSPSVPSVELPQLDLQAQPAVPEDLVAPAEAPRPARPAVRRKTSASPANARTAPALPELEPPASIATEATSPPSVPVEPSRAGAIKRTEF